MPVSVEFYGIPRLRAGVDRVEVEAVRLGEVLVNLAGRLPTLGAACIDGETLRPGYLANINGQIFTTNPQAALQPGDCILILSADVGG